MRSELLFEQLSSIDGDAAVFWDRDVASSFLEADIAFVAVYGPKPLGVSSIRVYCMDSRGVDVFVAAYRPLEMRWKLYFSGSFPSTSIYQEICDDT